MKNKKIKDLDLNLEKTIISRLSLNSLKGGANNGETVNCLTPETHVYRGCG